ncbi:SGNH/GDSL hydrolase family protein [Nakamurella deserti]|uniref:SGNH/GDSL hydrolase family protein n=1 Tax=Nakamurella deserti TaxID=2164074 RepID=UPI001300AD91|nr:SGNH/GDSL hydrolase family protein [Nakamurella deserti]
MTDDERTRFVRYTRPERWPLLDRFPVSGELHDRILAEILVDSTDEVRRRRHGLRSRAHDGAATLLADPAYQAALRRLPFHGGDRVAALGDSLTADRLGWFELLTHTMRLAGYPGVATHNLGLSGDTTADALERFDLLEAFRPTHVLVLLGTNDARRHGRSTDHRMVTPSETQRNLRVLDDLIRGTLHARAVFITPPPGDQASIDRSFAGETVRWAAAELDAVAAQVRDVAVDHIDLHRVLRRQPDRTWLDPDGVHLSAYGQRLTAATIAAGLSRSTTAGRSVDAADDREFGDGRDAGGAGHPGDAVDAAAGPTAAAD